MWSNPEPKIDLRKCDSLRIQHIDLDCLYFLNNASYSELISMSIEIEEMLKCFKLFSNYAKSWLEATGSFIKKVKK